MAGAPIGNSRCLLFSTSADTTNQTDCAGNDQSEAGEQQSDYNGPQNAGCLEGNQQQDDNGHGKTPF